MAPIGSKSVHLGGKIRAEFVSQPPKQPFFVLRACRDSFCGVFQQTLIMTQIVLEHQIAVPSIQGLLGSPTLLNQGRTALQYCIRGATKDY